MGILLDLTGKRYRMLVVVERAPNKHGRVAWKCKCDCGKTCITTTHNLRGSQISCGCVQKAGATERAIARNTKHGLARTPIYITWKRMKKRCTQTATHCRHNYYDRGITVCEEWKHDPVAFIKWAESNGFSKDLELDRIDNDSGYSPDNCRFVTRSKNCRNKSTNRMVEYNGEKMQVVEFAERYTKCSLAAVYQRIYAGWSLDRITTTA